MKGASPSSSPTFRGWPTAACSTSTGPWSSSPRDASASPATAPDLVGNRTLSNNDVIAPDNRQNFRESWLKNLQEKRPYRGEYEIVTASGRRKWVLETGQFVLDSLGEVEALEGIIIDITRRKQYEQRLQHSSEHD